MSPGTTGEARRRPPEQRRRLVVEAAREVIADRGLAATRLRDIATAAGVALGTVTYHFSGTREILIEVLLAETERFYRPVVDAVRTEPDPLAALQLLVDRLFDDSTEIAAHWRLWADYWTAAAHDKELASHHAERLRLWETAFTDTIRRGVVDGRFRCPSPEGTALRMAAFTDGLGIQLALEVPGLTPALARTWSRSLLDSELGTG